jgi:uncharacterized repeat protein (TIGR01451 family)
MHATISRLVRTSLFVTGLSWISLVFPHSVGQVQTTKFFAPETVQTLKARVVAGQSAGFQVGDLVSYIIQFSPIANGATVGANGYITDYIPSGTEVIGASFVSKAGTEVVVGDTYDRYVAVSPGLPGSMPSGRGPQANNTYLAPFNVNTYDQTGRCGAATAPTIANGNCNGRLSDVYADTGIFYSTDPRTQVFPALPVRLQQGTNGYFVNATREGQLNPIIGQADATTHNLWDAAMTNAFGTAALTTVTPNANAVVGILSSTGNGPIPYNAGSPVAGPQTGYQLDYSAQVGPWQRISASGSRIGDNTLGPSRGNSQNTPLANNGTGWVNATPYPLFVTGNPTSLGYNLSAGNPLPSGTNAVRWATGKLVVGQISYVKITLRVTAPVPAGGITNSSEVFGGDASDLTGTGTGGSIDNPWVYHVPSVADNNSNLYVSKTACQYDATATTCVPLSGSYFAGNSTITYQITYLNTGNANQTNVVLSDILPCQMAANTPLRVGLVTGPLSALITTPLTTTTSATAGNCTTTPQTRTTVTFPTITSLTAGAGGVMIINVKNTAATVNDDVVNTAKLSSTAVPGGVQSAAVTFVGNNTNPALVLTKSSLLSTGVSGGTAQYTIVMQNVGTGPATGVQLDDILPSTGGAVANASLRFNYASVVAIASTGLSTTTALIASTNTAALFTPALSPYSTQAGAENKVRVNFNFGGTSSLAAGGVITITFAVNIGAGVAASPAPYYNNVVAQSTVVPLYRVDIADTAPVTISSALSVAKTLDCYFVAGTCVPANGAGTIPPDSRVRYRIDYANTGGSTLNNVVLTDTLPCQISATAAPEATITAIISGPIAPTTTVPFAINTASGACPNTRPSFSMPAASLAAGQTGAFTVDVQLTTPASTSSLVVNDVTLSNGAATASAQRQLTVLTSPNLLITKTANSSVVTPGGTLSYTITITNVGTTAAQTITVYDWLPTGTSVTNDATRRFSFNTGSSVVAGALTAVTPVLNLPPTQAPYSGGTYAANQQELVWSFGGQSLAVGATASIVITVTAGANLPALPPPNYYYNNAKVTYFNGQQAGANAASANVSLAANLTVTKTNGTTALVAGNTTSYTVTFSNLGPSAAGGAVVKDAFSAGLSCTTVTCAATTGGASCPSNLALGTPVAAGSTALFTTGETIATLPANSTVQLLVQCGVTANGQ